MARAAMFGWAAGFAFGVILNVMFAVGGVQLGVWNWLAIIVGPTLGIGIVAVIDSVRRA